MRRLREQGRWPRQAAWGPRTRGNQPRARRWSHEADLQSCGIPQPRRHLSPGCRHVLPDRDPDQFERPLGTEAKPIARPNVRATSDVRGKRPSYAVTMIVCKPGPGASASHNWPAPEARGERLPLPRLLPPLLAGRQATSSEDVPCAVEFRRRSDDVILARGYPVAVSFSTKRFLALREADPVLVTCQSSEWKARRALDVGEE